MCFAILGAAACTSCRDDRDKDGVSDKQDKCPTVYAKTASGCPPEEKINALRFFIDRSSSMSGYYKGATDFVNATDDLLAKVDGESPISEIWMVSDSAEKFAGNADAFRAQVLRTQPKEAKSSMMDRIFETVTSKTGTDDISVFLSDGILSYSNKDIAGNKNINREKANALGTKIYSIFYNKLKKEKDFGTSIYAFKSAFNGTYYNYQNSKIKLSGNLRPYYIWVTGRKELLRKFNAELAGFSTFKPLEQLHLGLEEDPISKPTFIPSIEKLGAWSLNDDGTGIQDIGKAPARFCIAFDLSILPPYARKLPYLREHIHALFKGCTGNLQIKSKEEAGNVRLRSNRQRADYESATHLAIVDISRMNTATGSVQITLPVLPDPWYQSWSCTDDFNLQRSCAERTFAFSYLIEGIVQAYESRPRQYISMNIPLQQ